MYFIKKNKEKAENLQDSYILTFNGKDITLSNILVKRKNASVAEVIDWISDRRVKIGKGYF